MPETRSDAIDLKPTLVGPRVSLIPLEAAHREPLLAAARDGELWNLGVTSVPGPRSIDAYLETALVGRGRGTVIPFAIENDGEVVGSTRFWKLDSANRTVEIGHTWLAVSWQRTHVNASAKLLMLRHAFENLRCVRVQFQTDVLNERSRAAILRLGAVQEGILRHERIMPDGRKRNSVLFSVIDDEWPAVRAGLIGRLERSSTG